MSLIKVKVIDTQVSHREGVSTAGRPYKINSQDNVFVELNGEVRRVPLNLPENTGPYAPGNYTLDPLKLITVGRFGFEYNRFANIELVPVPASAVPTMNKMTG